MASLWERYQAWGKKQEDQLLQRLPGMTKKDLKLVEGFGGVGALNKVTKAVKAAAAARASTKKAANSFKGNTGQQATSRARTAQATQQKVIDNAYSKYLRQVNTGKVAQGAGVVAGGTAVPLAMNDLLTTPSTDFTDGKRPPFVPTAPGSISDVDLAAMDNTEFDPRIPEQPVASQQVPASSPVATQAQESFVPQPGNVSQQPGLQFDPVGNQNPPAWQEMIPNNIRALGAAPGIPLMNGPTPAQQAWQQHVAGLNPNPASAPATPSGSGPSDSAPGRVATPAPIQQPVALPAPSPEVMQQQAQQAYYQQQMANKFNPFGSGSGYEDLQLQSAYYGR